MSSASQYEQQAYNKEANPCVEGNIWIPSTIALNIRPWCLESIKHWESTQAFKGQKTKYLFTYRFKKNTELGKGTKWYKIKQEGILLYRVKIHRIFIAIVLQDTIKKRLSFQQTHLNEY